MSSGILRKFAVFGARLFRVLFADLPGALKQARVLAGHKTSRGFAKTCGISREIIRKIETGERLPDVRELVQWLEACRIEPVSYFADMLDPEAAKEIQRATQSNRAAIKTLRVALRDKSRRAMIEGLFDAWFGTGWRS